MSSETIVYNEIKYRRYPDSDLRASREYYTPGIADKLNGAKTLHQQIWIDANGPIEEGFVVHHVDGNSENNTIENLACIPLAEHASLHAREPHRIESARACIHKAQEAATVWHGSDEGRAWHSIHGKEIWENRKPTKKVCQQCGAEYETKSKNTSDKFCSNACRAAARRKSGVDNETRKCCICGESFVCNKYSKVVTCSRSCGTRLQWKSRR